MDPYHIHVFLLLLSGILTRYYLCSAASDDQVRCGNRREDICDEMDILRTEVDVNTADRKKWNRHFQFVQKFHRSWEDEVTKVAQSLLGGVSADPNLRNDLLNDNRQLKSEMTYMRTRLAALEGGAVNLKSELQEQKVARQRIENDIEVLQRSKGGGNVLLGNVYNPGGYQGAFNTKDFVLDLRKKVGALESRESEFGDDLMNLQIVVKELQMSVFKLQKAGLKVANVLRVIAPPDVVEDIERDLNFRMKGLDDSEREIEHLTPFQNVTTGSVETGTLMDMNAKVEDLQSNMRILTEMMGKAMSNIKILESKYNDALRAQMRQESRPRPGPKVEFVAPHSKHAPNRPFDPQRDP